VWRIAVLAAMLASSGCALLVNANAHHNSGGSACMTSPIPGGIDLAIAGATGALIMNAEDTSKGWLVLPGLFAASGLYGIASAAGCRSSEEAAESSGPPASNTAPSFGDAPVDPEAREATREEMGLAPPPADPPKLTLDRNGLPASLPPTPVPPPAPDPEKEVRPPSSPDPKPMTCKLEPKLPCPDGYYCRLTAENTGECVQIR
jgi:hypothetical protein